ncbi:hypothetical protein NSK_007085 [Nannochloropsis salina CCMP1776]|uniref:Trichohyalin-plectin-homology domain-containing protein n=1 Tax=Nannochloropsis salina CCMP1776 TaxID=1027361 RepID=A0A4D9CZN0_9STRA|nr:hypothetical protein NSK_007085 [Nannochloropsis salina CCMP1776]|eukprot:TFJ81838.1 hypothetical protein NSK_007085 [Nannochloropsis salina CCMP1776]
MPIQTVSSSSCTLPTSSHSDQKDLSVPIRRPDSRCSAISSNDVANSALNILESDTPRQVTRQGLTLRQLYQLKRNADAWHLMDTKRRQDQISHDKEILKKVQNEKRDLSRFYDGQVRDRQAQEEATKAESRAWAQQLEKDAQMQKEAEQAARNAHMSSMVAYRTEFCKDMERTRQQKLLQRQKQIERERTELEEARRVAIEQIEAMQRQKRADRERMKEIQEDVQQQTRDRIKRKQEEAEEIIRLGKEWEAAQDKKDREQHAAFQKVVARQEAKEISYSMTAQEVLKRKVEEDERRALRHQELARAAHEAEEKRRKEKQKAATIAQLKALDLEMRLKAERKEQMLAEERAMAEAMLSRNQAAQEEALAKQRAMRTALKDYQRLLAKQIQEQQEQNQRITVGFVQPSEMALNKALFEQIGYVSPDPTAPPVEYIHKDPRIATASGKHEPVTGAGDMSKQR